MIYGLILIMTLLSSFASYFLKKSTQTDSFLKMFLNFYFYLGGFLYVLAVGCNIILLQFLPYAVILPLGSFTYIWTMILSHRLLKEKITFKKTAGISLIILGVVFVALGS